MLEMLYNAGMNFRTVLGCSLLLLPLSLSANEQKEAQAACERVMTLIDYQQQGQGQGSVASGSICNVNTRTTAYWSCIEDRVKKDETFAFAASQCEKIDPQ